MYQGRTIGVVVPAYNERDHVGAVVASIPAFVDRVYVVDDGSTDGTWDVILDSAPEVVVRSTDPPRSGDDPDEVGRFVAIRHEENCGAGAAIKTGYLHARADGVDVTVTVDADGQMDPGEMRQIVEPVVRGEADYAKGNRLANPDFCAEMPRFRWVGNWLLTLLTKVASGYWGLRDPQNGYTAISHRALSAVPLEEMYEYYGYCNDLLVKLNAAEMRIADVPLPAAYRDEESSIRYAEYVPRVSAMLARNFVWRLRVRYFDDDPNVVALLYGIGVVGAAVGLVSATAGMAGIDPTGRALSRTAVPLLSLAAGGAFVALAMALDGKENRHLEVSAE